MLNDTEQYFYVRNAQGDIIGIINSIGKQVVSYTYDTWGKLISITGDKALGEKNPYRYRGYRYDTETGYYYLQSRYYNPEWGRFLNADGLVSTGQGMLAHNMFIYCLNNPASNKDDNGFLCSSITDGATSSSSIDHKNSQDPISRGSAFYGGYYSVKSSTGSVRTVINGTAAHRGKIMIYGRGTTDRFVSKFGYIVDEMEDAFKGSFNLKGNGFKGAAKGIVAVGMIANGVNNYIEYDGNIKHAIIGWSVDTLSDILTGSLTAGAVAAVIAFTGVTMPVWTSVAVVATFSYGISELSSGVIGGIKDSIISGF